MYLYVSRGKIKIKLLKHLKEKYLKNFLNHRLKKLSMGNTALAALKILR